MVHPVSQGLRAQRATGASDAIVYEIGEISWETWELAFKGLFGFTRCACLANGREMRATRKTVGML